MAWQQYFYINTDVVVFVVKWWWIDWLFFGEKIEKIMEKIDVHAHILPEKLPSFKEVCKIIINYKIL